MPTFPSVHINGTGAESLIDGYMRAAQAVQKAMDALQDAGPNGRDYYVQGGTAFGAAQTEHVARYKALKIIYDELYSIVENVSEQHDARTSRRAT